MVIYWRFTTYNWRHQPLQPLMFTSDFIVMHSLVTKGSFSASSAAYDLSTSVSGGEDAKNKGDVGREDTMPIAPI